MLKELKKRNHFSSLEKREAKIALKEKEAKERGEKTEAEINQWWKYKPSGKRRKEKGLPEKVKLLKEQLDTLDALKLKKFKEKQELEKEKDKALVFALLDSGKDSDG